MISVLFLAVWVVYGLHLINMTKPNRVWHLAPILRFTGCESDPHDGHGVFI
jgi:hypothetical protein